MWPADWEEWLKILVQILIHIKNDFDCDKHQNCSNYARDMLEMALRIFWPLLISGAALSESFNNPNKRPNTTMTNTNPFTPFIEGWESKIDFIQKSEIQAHMSECQHFLILLNSF